MSNRIICGTCCISRGDDGSSGSDRGCSRIRTLEITKCRRAVPTPALPTRHRKSVRVFFAMVPQFHSSRLPACPRVVTVLLCAPAPRLSSSSHSGSIWGRCAAMPNRLCIRCLEWAPCKKCAFCRGPWYCGPDCQTADWERHRRECPPARVRREVGPLLHDATPLAPCMIRRILAFITGPSRSEMYLDSAASVAAAPLAAPPPSPVQADRASRAYHVSPSPPCVRASTVVVGAAGAVPESRRWK